VILDGKNNAIGENGDSDGGCDGNDTLTAVPLT
jgi:hypothetical protein